MQEHKMEINVNWIKSFSFPFLTPTETRLGRAPRKTAAVPILPRLYLGHESTLFPSRKIQILLASTQLSFP